MDVTRGCWPPWTVLEAEFHTSTKTLPSSPSHELRIFFFFFGFHSWISPVSSASGYYLKQAFWLKLYKGPRNVRETRRAGRRETQNHPV